MQPERRGSANSDGSAVALRSDEGRDHALTRGPVTLAIARRRSPEPSGRPLVAALNAHGHSVAALTRDPEKRRPVVQARRSAARRRRTRPRRHRRRSPATSDPRSWSTSSPRCPAVHRRDDARGSGRDSGRADRRWQQPLRSRRRRGSSPIRRSVRLLLLPAWRRAGRRERTVGRTWPAAGRWRNRRADRRRAAHAGPERAAGRRSAPLRVLLRARHLVPSRRRRRRATPRRTVSRARHRRRPLVVRAHRRRRRRDRRRGGVRHHRRVQHLRRQAGSRSAGGCQPSPGTWARRRHRMCRSGRTRIRTAASTPSCYEGPTTTSLVRNSASIPDRCHGTETDHDGLNLMSGAPPRRASSRW